MCFPNKPHPALAACNKRRGSRFKGCCPSQDPPEPPPPAPNKAYEIQLLSLPHFSDLFCRKPVRYDTRNCIPSRIPEPVGPHHYTLEAFQLLHLHPYPGLEVPAFRCNSWLPRMQSLGTTLPVIHIPAVIHCLLNIPILGSFKMKLGHWKINSDQLYSPQCDLSVS